MSKSSMGKERNWTEEEKQYLKENWGTVSIRGMMDHLNRSKNAILVMKCRLRLGAYLDSGDYVTWNQLIQALGMDSSAYLKKSRIRDRGFPVRTKRVIHNSFRVVYLDEFWKWAEQNRSLLDFAKFEENALGAEPKWAKEKRRRDFEHSRHFITTPWTAAEDQKLRHLLEKQRYTCRELSQELRRTEGAITKRIHDLDIKDRPVKADNMIKWTDEEFRMLGELIKAGCSYEAMAKEIGKSAKAIRGRVYAMYLTENLDKARQMIGNGSWGDNRPERKVRHYNAMSPEEKAETKALLERLATALHQEFRNRVNETEWGDFFQKDMCRNFSGACLKTAGCDECIYFERVRPQACRMCGKTFYERKWNDFCSSCRDMRRRQYIRKRMAMMK